MYYIYYSIYNIYSTYILRGCLTLSLACEVWSLLDSGRLINT